MADPTAPTAAFFDEDWLKERESADHVARVRALDERLAGWVGRRCADRRSSHFALVDLGSGTGSNTRYLAPVLPAGQQWTLVDHDAGHLGLAERRCSGLAGVASLTPRRHAMGIQDLVDTIPEPTDVVTASALLDLMSCDWIVALAARTRACNAAGLFTLSYSGDFEITPAHADDRWLRDTVNQHQQTDKGTGAALGPIAWQVCAEAFAATGYRVWNAASDWMLGPDAGSLQAWLVRGWAQAATELRPRKSARVERWCQARLASIQSGEARIAVSHRDVLVLPRDGDSDGRRFE